MIIHKSPHYFLKLKGTFVSNCYHIRLRLFTKTTSNLQDRNHNTILNELKVPKASIRWFYASDVPISKPDWFNYQQTKEPESFIPFSEYDSKRLERNYQLSSTKPIEVNEDKLFEVDLEKLQLSPVYWEGPIYEVRRGLWFSSNGIPLSKKQTVEIEEAFNKLKPYLFTQNIEISKKTAKANKEKISKFNKLNQLNNKEQKEKEKLQDEINIYEHKIDYLSQKDLCKLSDGNVVLFFNKNQAAIFPETYNSFYQIDVIRYFGPSQVSLLGVNHIQRGYSEELKEGIFDKLSKNPLPSIADSFQLEFGSLFGNNKKGELKEAKKEEDHDIEDKYMQKYLEGDYDLETSKSKSNREIDHLILCIHGIGQVLGNKYESVNFTHNINVLRNTMKRVFEENDQYRKLISKSVDEEEVDPNNNRIQVLPISWRHRVDFNPQETGTSRLPSLSQLNVEGIKALRNIVGDVVLDILLYYEPKYLDQIFTAVTSELNRVYKLFKEKNPNFKGKVHILGHSLGSAIAFDILSGQSGTLTGSINVTKDITFEVENLFLAGSPVGMFKLLEGKNIKSRKSKDFQPTKEDNFVSPKCANLYNLFHPCDPVAYRIEPLVQPKFGDFRPVPVDFAVKGLNKQIKDLASFGDEITEKISSAARWLRISISNDEIIENPKSIEEQAKNENALGDIITSIAISDQDKDEAKKGKIKRKEIEGEVLKNLTNLNKSGRMDYSLPMGVLDFSLVSAVSAHISYFDDENTAGFLIKEVLTDRSKPVEKLIVSST
ncbi:unnamed protein product [Candida verbasci]|uniref:DDHD domain-containing protein n=1 Tax=Candida verbasci TaxID=1227364 RepID=A0A9W4XBV6_9ASCO|nr:unnamed protein product [Candida verbasci]